MEIIISDEWYRDVYGYKNKPFLTKKDITQIKQLELQPLKNTSEGVLYQVNNVNQLNQLFEILITRAYDRGERGVALGYTDNDELIVYVDDNE